ncbi:MAG: ATP-dependent sacrificial sulfur transferase LarE [Desulfamplus sp.]|nr:ATP-dependent sacrificial sulfur transferase LarE [Desulfamplus sp.]
MNSKMQQLQSIIKNSSPFAIAFSGGVDSSFLAGLAWKLRPGETVALTGDSVFLSRLDRANALEVAQTIGISHEMVPVDIMTLNIARNGHDRCYLCKKKMLGALKQRASILGFPILFDGVNIDDLNDYRPGIKAAQELEVLSPLVKSGFTKDDIRRESKKMALCTWDMPPQSCLATRVPYGDTLTLKILARIELCEAYLTGLGFNGIRVRCHGDMARIESPSHMISQIADSTAREEIIPFFKEQGFNLITLDICGYQSDNISPNHESELLLEPQKS